MQKKETIGVISGIFGILLIISGLILIILGESIFNNFQEQVEYFFAHGSMDSFGSNVKYFGIALIVLGGILVFISIYLGVQIRRQFAEKQHTQNFNEVDDVITQLAGNKTIFDIFHSEDNTKIFSFYRNKTCILKINDKIYRGKMEPLTWENGHPTLWRIHLNMNGRLDTCEITKVEGNILVKNDTGEQIFYRN